MKMKSTHAALLMLLMAALLFTHCKKEESCTDGKLNQNEAGIDCGGVCSACATCADGIRNQDETGVDCGGTCPNVCSIISNRQSYTTANSGIPSDYIADVLEVGSAIWVATDHGVGALANGNWTVYTAANSSLPSDNVTDLMLGNDGSIWMATSGGVARLNAGNWTIYNSSTGAPAALDASIKLAQSLNWTIVVSQSQGFLIYDTFTWTHYTTGANGMNSIVDVAAGPNQELYFATQGSGLITYINFAFYNYDAFNSGLPDFPATSVRLHTPDDVWIGTQRGLVRKEGNVWANANVDVSSIRSDDAFVLFVDSDQAIWLNAGGLSKFDGNTWTHFTTANSDSHLSGTKAFLIDANGLRWAGTRQNGLISFRQP